MAIGQPANPRRIQRYGLVDAVDHHEIVTESVHFGEVQFHGVNSSRSRQP
jgi:hypothetical protein